MSELLRLCFHPSSKSFRSVNFAKLFLRSDATRNALPSGTSPKLGVGELAVLFIKIKYFHSSIQQKGTLEGDFIPPKYLFLKFYQTQLVQINHVFLILYKRDFPRMRLSTSEVNLTVHFHPLLIENRLVFILFF